MSSSTDIESMNTLCEIIHTLSSGTETTESKRQRLYSGTQDVVSRVLCSEHNLSDFQNTIVEFWKST